MAIILTFMKITEIVRIKIQMLLFHRIVLYQENLCFRT